MKLQRYDLELIHTHHTNKKEVEDRVNMIVESLPVSDAKSKQISEDS